MPLPPALPAILAAAAAIPQIGKIGMGLFQSRKAKRLSDRYNLEDRPRASMTEGFNQYLSQAERMAGSDLPGRDILEGDIRQSTSKGLTSARQLASTESSAMAGMLGLMEQERASMRRLGAQALQWQAQQQQNLSQAYLRKGQEEQRIWETNEWMPWQMGMNQAESFRKAGRQNIFSGLEGLSAVAIKGAGMMKGSGGLAMGQSQDSFPTVQHGMQWSSPPAMPQAPPVTTGASIPVSGGAYDYNYNNIYD